MNKTPEGWQRITPAVFYDDASAAIDWLCRVFGFEIRLKVEGPDGRIEHSELELADGLLMVGSTHARRHCRSPRSIDGGNTQSLMVFVDDVDAFCAKAKEAGATVLMEPKTSDYGDEFFTDRSCEIRDLEGHHWWFVQRLREQKGPAPKYVKHG